MGLPQLAGPTPWRGGLPPLFQQARSLLPVLRAAAAGMVLLALLAGAFVAGRSSGPASAAPAAPAATASTLTLPGGRQLSGSAREFDWRVLRGKVTLVLRAMFTAGDTTSISFEAFGLDPGWTLGNLEDVRIFDEQGQEVAVSGIDQELPVFRSREAGPGISLATVVLQRRIDPSSVVRVSVGRLVLGQQFDETLSGTLLDKDLKHRVDQQQEQGGPVTADVSASCPSCQLRVRCESCQTIRVGGATYRHGRVTLLLTPRRPTNGSVADGVITVSGQSGQIGSLHNTLESGETVVTFGGVDLAAISETGHTNMPFMVMASLTREQRVQGPWEIDQRSGSR
jgi:hypothetical protein